MSKNQTTLEDKKVREALSLWVNQINNPKLNYTLKSKKLGIEITIPI